MAIIKLFDYPFARMFACGAEGSGAWVQTPDGQSENKI
jgi:hypothetical protein